MCTTSLSRNESVHPVMNPVKMVVGVKDHIIVRNFPKSTVHHSVIKEGALDPIQGNVVTCSVLVDAQVRNRVTVW